MKDGVIEESYPLTPLQEGMLYHHLSSLHAGIDLAQIVCVLPEEIDAPLLRSAWDWVVARYPALRTAFRWDRLGHPVQEVHREVALPFEVHDWEAVPPAEQETRFEDFLRADRERGFELDEVPNLRVSLFKLSRSHFNLVWTVHHILTDAQAMSIVLTDVADKYLAAREGELLELPKPKPYRHHIDWLRNRDRAVDERYWRERLRGFTSPTPLPLEASPAGLQPRPDAHQDLVLSREETDALRSMADGIGVSLSAVLHGAWGFLLSRYSRQREVIFGSVRACRKSVADASSMVGLFINTIPVRVIVEPETEVEVWLRKLKNDLAEAREFEFTSLVDIQQWCDLPSGTPLFETLMVFDYTDLQSKLRKARKWWNDKNAEILQQTNYALTIFVYAQDVLSFQLAYDRERFNPDSVGQILRHLRTVLNNMAANPRVPLSQLRLLPEEDLRRVLVDRNQTSIDFCSKGGIADAFEEQVQRRPDAVALRFHATELSYRQLDTRANQLAHYLIKRGVDPEALVGISLRRSVDLVVALLAALKAGAAYLPLDPNYPSKRLSAMLEDAQPAVLLTESEVISATALSQPPVVLVDAERRVIAEESESPPSRQTRPESCAYVIYTSGSTGIPKGVMLEQRNVMNFFAAMDRLIQHDPPGVWLAVTNFTFDISVLELLWTLCRGFEIVLYPEPGGEEPPVPESRLTAPPDFSLFYFAADESAKDIDKYRLLLEGAKFADQHSFQAVWTPERHFHAFGGLYPNPSVVSAAIAAVTQRVAIRAGSVVLPLHNPVRVAEEWSLVDNLSQGRVGISFASGWFPNDFVLAPDSYRERHEVMYRAIETVRALWRGEAIHLRGPDGSTVETRTLPRPIQKELPVWVTAAGSQETFRSAGRIGANLLTHLLGQSIEELAQKIHLYREARREHGHDRGHVTIMLHTFVSDDEEFVRSEVREPLKSYLRTATSLMKESASSFWRYRKLTGRASQEVDREYKNLTHEEMEELLEYAFARYYETSGLFGTPEQCLVQVEKLMEIGVDEIACLIDFGISPELVLENLKHLHHLRELASRNEHRNGSPRSKEVSLPDTMNKYHVTYLQCTPTLASLLVADEESRKPLGRLKQMLVGGEALSTDLCRKLKPLVGGELINMYGPTETTIWSATYSVKGDESPIPIGRPIGNTQIYILDEDLNPMPVGAWGEIFIGGQGVARGYLNRPELTAERFIKNPFDHGGSARLYRTGDLGRFREDGEIEFLGRADFQIKIRGHRVELGEIESVLLAEGSVEQAVVTATSNGAGNEDTRLAAYVVAKPGRDLAVTELRKFLRSQLPEHMVPQHILELDALPLLPSGKLDRKALPRPFDENIERETALVPPRTHAECYLAVRWKELLGVEQVGVHDKFFDLGGHSLLSMQLAARVKSETGVQLSPVTVVTKSLRETAMELERRATVDLSAIGTSSNGIASRIVHRLRSALPGKWGEDDFGAG